MKNLINKLFLTGVFLGFGNYNIKAQEINVKSPYKDWQTISSEHASITFEYERDSLNAKRALEAYEDFGIFPIQGKRKITLSDKFEWFSQKTITGNFKSLDDSTFFIALFHENAHLFFEEHKTPFTEDQIKLNDTIEKVNNMVFDTITQSSGFYISEDKNIEVFVTGDGQSMHIKDYRRLSPNPLIREISSKPGIEYLFAESIYITLRASLQGNDSLKSSAGHPQQGTSELFASASTVLYFFPKEFFGFVEAIERFEKEDNKYLGYAELTRKIARNVVLSYGERCVFSDEVYQKLDLEK